MIITNEEKRLERIERLKASKKAEKNLSIESRKMVESIEDMLKNPGLLESDKNLLNDILFETKFIKFIENKNLDEIASHVENSSYDSVVARIKIKQQIKLIAGKRNKILRNIKEVHGIEKFMNSNLFSEQEKNDFMFGIHQISKENKYSIPKYFLNISNLEVLLNFIKNKNQINEVEEI